MEKPQLIIIMKNTGVSCNIGCIYCIEEQKQYTSSQKFITIEQAEKLARMTQKYSLNVLFHGGEPTLLKPDYYEKLMDIFEKYNDDVFFGMQTNATQIDDKWIVFLKNNRERIGISVSLDGPEEVNRFRMTKQGDSTFNLVYRNINKLFENGIQTGLLCTVVSSSIGKEEELYNMITSFSNLKFVKINPCMDKNSDGTLPFWAVTPKQYYSFISNFFDIMLKKGNWGYNIEPIISVLKRLQGVRSAYCNYNNEKCPNFLTIYPDGTITSCDNYNLQHGLIGRLYEISDLNAALNMEQNLELKESYTKLLEKCEKCDANNLCSGGCIAVRERYSDTEEYCEAIKGMIHHIKMVYDALKIKTDGDNI